MQDASAPRMRFSRVSRDFQTSRLEKALLAAAYECAVPTVSRSTRRTWRECHAKLARTYASKYRAKQDWDRRAY